MDGKTVSLIGYPEQKTVARKGIDMLLEGEVNPKTILQCFIFSFRYG